MTTMTRPDRSEAADYYFRYIDQVRDEGDICRILEEQHGETLVLLRSVPAERSLNRYAPDKWSIREVVGHVNDTERLFVFRALWFARALGSELPSFDQDIAVSAAGSDARSWDDLVEEFDAIRRATLGFFRSVPENAWMRRGTASGNPFTVRALAYITAGHVTHHNAILREKYLRA